MNKKLRTSLFLYFSCIWAFSIPGWPKLLDYHDKMLSMPRRRIWSTDEGELESILTHAASLATISRIHQFHSCHLTRNTYLWPPMASYAAVCLLLKNKIKTENNLTSFNVISNSNIDNGNHSNNVGVTAKPKMTTISMTKSTHCFGTVTQDR